MFKNKIILITGFDGLWKKFVSILKFHSPKKVIIYSRDEYQLPND